MFVLLSKSKTKICSSILPLITAQHIHPLLPRFFSAPPTNTPNFMVADYLVSSFGFSPDKAAKVSKSIAHLKSPVKPDSVRNFLKEQGFSEAEIKKLITWQPDLLCSSPEKTLDPNLRTLRDMGLSTSALNQIILHNPTALLRHSAAPRIIFWLDFLGGDETALVKAFMRNTTLANYDVSTNIAPKISILRSQGFSTQDIRWIVCMVPRFITSRIDGMDDLLNRVKELGFQPGSGMFLQGLNAMAGVTRAALKKKTVLLKSFGWSEDDFFSAVLRAPHIFGLKEENLHAKMDFLLGEARCPPSYNKSHPILLSFSLEKRLRPRNNILHLLKERGLAVKEQSFVNTIKLTNNQFMESYIIPYREEITGIHETYLNDCA